ncbi:MAG: hypothetical protein Q8L48_19660 [Archangium sp.]|nr:hypothetical protein [Archangium sp.]
MRSVLTRVATVYVAGDDVQDARRVADTWARRGIPATFGFWDDGRDTPRDVANQYLLGLDALRPEEYLSIKLTALDYSEALLEELAERAAQRHLRLHFDSMYPDTVDRTRALVTAFAARWGSKFPIGFTLPGRWARSLDDAAWACELRLPVRVVKGQFPAEPAVDPIEGFDHLIEALAGKAAHVAVATHDPELGERSLRRLAEKGTSRELELLHGLPMRKSLRAAEVLGEKVRVYIGYGRAHVPYAVSKVMENPKMMMWMARDLLHL